MAETETETRESDAQQALAFFELKSSPNGRFLHYCWQRSRTRSFMARQVFVVIICGTLMVLENLWLGLISLAFVCAADVLDCIWLRYVWARWRRVMVPQSVRLISLVTAAFQSAAIAAAIVYAWHFTFVSSESGGVGQEFFGFASLLAILLNAGFIYPYVPAIAVLKSAVISLSMAFIVASRFWTLQDFPAWLMTNAYTISAIIILGFMSESFLRVVNDSFRRNQTAREALLRNQLALSRATAASEQRELHARRLALIAENTNESIFVTDADERIFWTNAAFTQITGYTPEDVMGRRPGDFMDAPQTSKETVDTLNRMRRQGRKGRAEILSRFKDGSLRWIHTSMTPVFDEAGVLTMCISVERDMTEEKKRIRELAEANEQAKAAAKAKERFFATMSHEIRTPMNGVMGMAELLSRSELNAEQRGYLTAIMQSGEALLGIINDILDLSKLQSGKVQVAEAAFDLAAVVSAVVVLLRPLASDKGLDLPVPEGCATPVWVRGDGGRVRQVLMNLVGNAIKFTAHGSVKVTLLIKAEGDFAIVVKDTGIGIAADRLEAVFDSFTQADSEIDRQFGGTGLGLTISRMLARAMGGDVQVASQAGEGSAFSFTLKLPPADAVLVPLQAIAPAVVSLFSDGRTRILIAEDNRTNRLILRKMLEAENVVLSEVENGAEAVACYRDGAPDLVVMDMQMPVMDGLTAIRTIRAEEKALGLPRCPILVLSANVFPEDAQASFEADCDDFLTKPVLRDDLLARTQRLLVQGAAERALPGEQLLA